MGRDRPADGSQNAGVRSAQADWDKGQRVSSGQGETGRLGGGREERRSPRWGWGCLGNEKGLGAQEASRTECGGTVVGHGPTCHLQQVPREGETSQCWIQGSPAPGRPQPRSSSRPFSPSLEAEKASTFPGAGRSWTLKGAAQHSGLLGRGPRHRPPEGEL